MSTIESSVTRLLVATKHLLESLTQWAKKSANESDISDSYVQLGNEFKVACRAFSNAGVDVSDLGDVPHSLRVVLEEALCEPPSQESLDKFLPTIREIIVTLLQNLKSKQAMVRTLRSNRPDDSRTSSITDHDTHKRSISSSSSSSARPAVSRSSSNNLPKQRSISHSGIGVSNSKEESPVEQKKPENSKENTTKGQNNALLQLQKGDSLQRRASRRFSAYQYAKLTNYSPGRDPELPTARLQDETRKASNLVQSQAGSPLAQKVIPNQESTLTVFLKIGDKVKKTLLPLPITFTSLRLLFVEKFAYSPGSGSFPDIYIDDKLNGISYMLEEHLFQDIQEGSVISLKVSEKNTTTEDLKKTIQDLHESYHSKFEELTTQTRLQIEESQNKLLEVIQHNGIQSTDTSKKPLETKEVGASMNKGTKTTSLLDDISDITDIRHDVSVIKQINNNNKVNFKQSIESVLNKVQEFKALSLDTSKSSNRTYMEESNQKLSNTSDALLTKFDDLQDIIEALRKDVAQRGARPTVKQIQFISKQISDATSDLDNMVKYISTEKPNWKKIWESELDTVCSEQQFLTLQEDLAHDLKEDLEKATETFDLVKQCCEEQTKNPKTRTANLPIPDPGSTGNLRDALLSEVEALRPNHNGRVEAIEKAEKLRQKERQLTMLSGFEEELGGFVENSKLKKSGGVEEIDRVRRMKDEQNLRSNFAPF
ncbi:Actin-interacting protein 3 [Wickerhamomyces ciferrii]|uniref:Actin-interacting protein 3 n=1 Tax=Wickerhamomyces ciferrii (strain ATCC 14091 / BCRC 22168 / CBS 111 / JCM 3599 / NBRC 0793 / NRRL Y-1031 F-60-10) TaxID=1206466 RepID=K0KD18_WICCF|nr:Actin-interacting protein 3 [Wickerhamomyces ciferrii]CCH40766.1 Actin-interacting protein 3 [Wickerhamomyces ciferrii]